VHELEMVLAEQLSDRLRRCGYALTSFDGDGR
jgi:hypothetical protein